VTAGDVRQPGIRNTTWEVHRARPLPWLTESVSSGIYARFVGRDGLGFACFIPMADEVLGDIAAGEASGVRFLESAWDEFRWQLDRRYDDPYAFWPRIPIGKGRWAA
jgi:hypothetical protein